MAKSFLTFDSHSIAKTGGFDTKYMCRETQHVIDETTLFELLKIFDVEWRNEWYGDHNIGNILTFNSQDAYDMFMSVSTIINE